MCDVVLEVVQVVLLLLLLLLFKLELTPGGVDSSRSGTTGEGDVIELKFDNVVVEEEQDDGDGAIVIPLQGSPLPVTTPPGACVCSVSITMLPPPPAGRSVGDSSSSNMQIGGCAGI